MDQKEVEALVRQLIDERETGPCLIRVNFEKIIENVTVYATISYPVSEYRPVVKEKVKILARRQLAEGWKFTSAKRIRL